jgi:hypothetical protein
MKKEEPGSDVWQAEQMSTMTSRKQMRTRTQGKMRTLVRARTPGTWLRAVLFNG